MRLRQFLAAFAIMALLATGATVVPGTTPTAAAAANYWGAIAWNYNGRTAYAVNYHSQNGAVRAAKARCGRNCGWIAFYRSCGAAAYKFSGHRTRVGTARGYATRASAQRAAKRKAGYGSHIRAWACTAGR
ncbi:DUF4189 domain-containing protein [Gordonia sp. (in: high G+C Gram-positive bacteria)]|uniref:DUF4189 domain-containing protein n=1 Tax=Gordonia sp. (in: high G+C Gram-positive bacteria) TaxID=84139 RepID=UPI003F9628D5